MTKSKMFSKRTFKMNPFYQYQRRVQYHHARCVTQCLLLKSITLLIAWTMMLGTVVISAPPHAAVVDSKRNQAHWPRLKYHDIWNDHDLQQLKASEKHEGDDDEIYDDDSYSNEFPLSQSDNNWSDAYDFVRSTNESNIPFISNSGRRRQKVIHLFPVPVDGECLSDDGRRTGTCFNAYECRSKGGQSKGACAHGFGVCCIFIANCNETVSNNITYLVSPSFPSFMPNNVTNCNLKIKLMNDDISQVRIDFYHFILGQPNRRTGVCDGDVFNVSGGPAGTFSLCGQNSGQHMYYDVGGRMLPRQVLYGSLRPLRYEDLYPGSNSSNLTSTEVNIDIHFAPRFLPTRLWEIRISQIPFSQRAPAGCLQYFTGTEGVFQTFNFADNGRHLANQNYRICMRQEVEMCSIVYQPCDVQSFRIGPGSSSRFPSTVDATNFNGAGASPAFAGSTVNMALMDYPQTMDPVNMMVLSDDASVVTQMSNIMTDTTTISSTTTGSTTLAPANTTVLGPTNTSAVPAVTTSSTTSAADDPAADDPIASADTTTSPATTTAISSTTTTTMTPSTTASTLSDDVEGSGGNVDDDTRFRPTPAQRPRPTRGGFDLLGFLRSAFDFGLRKGRNLRYLNERQKRQFYSSCRDRITMPCIVEDFIGTGLGPLPGCEPVHCGMNFCSNGMWPCRIESTVTPFYVGVHFGDGGGKGSAEDNIGACLRYQQVQCMR